MIAAELIEQIRDAADIVSLIGEHVELKRTGADYRGPCPFHGGTHRNFSVVPRKQLYHCFVCHESGDVFTFWMKRFGLDYPTAVREIAGKVGIVVPETRQAGPDPNEPLYSALGVTAEWFQRRLRDGAEAEGARRYLESRALAPELWDEFGLGFAPSSREAMLEGLHALGLDDETLVAAGLVVKREDGSIGARFRGRLLFPIADVRGRITGFGGRIIGEGEPKYLNSPESAVFHKGGLLYLLDRARGGIRGESLAVVVEGYVDAIRLHAAGITNVVAPLGTALTQEQSRVLRRYTKQVLLSYDADIPGLRSTFRAGDELLRQGVAVAVLTLPPGEDPDTLVAKGGAAAYRALMGEAVDLFERKLQLLDRKGLFGTLEGRRRALDRLLPTIRAAADPITRELYTSRAAERTGVGKAVLEQEVQKGDRRTGAPQVDYRAAEADGADAGAGRHRPPDRLAALPPDIPQERALVELMVRSPAWVERAVRDAVTADQFRHPLYREIAATLLAGGHEPPATDLMPLWEALARPPEGELDAEAQFSAAVQWMRERPLRDRLHEIDRLIALAEPEAQEALMQEKTDLRGRIEPRYGRKAFRTEREPA